MEIACLLDEPSKITTHDLMRIQDLVTKLENEVNKMKYEISITWNQDDVLYVAEQMGLTLTNEQIMEVLDYVESNHDANLGISWDTIGWAIETVLPVNLNK